MNTKNAPPDATAKPCPKIDVEFVVDTAASINRVLEQSLISTADLDSHGGQFNDDAGDDVKQRIFDIAAAKVGVDYLTRTLEQAHFAIVSLQARYDGLDRLCAEQQKEEAARGVIRRGIRPPFSG